MGSTGLEVGVLGAALAATYDVNLAATARAADFVEAQSLRWVAELIGFPESEGAFTSGGMTSNLTALLVAREDALPGSRTAGFDGTRPPSTARPRRTTRWCVRPRRPASANRACAGCRSTPTGACGPPTWPRRSRPTARAA